MALTSIRPTLLAAAVAVAFTSLDVQATVDLVAIGTISGTYQDLAHQTATELENGVAGNRLGGMGSALAHAGGTSFLALPDRGPNAVEYNSALDNTTSYIPRFHTLDLSLAPNPAYDVNDPNSLRLILTPTLRNTTLLHAGNARLVYGTNGEPTLNTRRIHYFTGRSDAFDPAKNSGNSADGRFDPEGIRVSRDGSSVFVSDEYGPYVYQFNRKSGQRIKSFALPGELLVTSLSAQGAVEISGNTSGRVANKGMEGLAITPDGKTLIGFVQSALLQDGGDGARVNRILAIDIASGRTRQFAYDNYLADTEKTYGSSEILAINSHEFLVLERDGKGLGDGSSAKVKRLYKIDLAGATDISGLSGESNLLPLAVGKELFLDVKSALGAKGIAADRVPAKLEGAAFGPDVTIDGKTLHTLYIANDNDFDVSSDNPNQIFVFSFGDEDLPGYVPQTIQERDELECGS